MQITPTQSPTPFLDMGEGEEGEGELGGRAGGEGEGGEREKRAHETTPDTGCRTCTCIAYVYMFQCAGA